jgi:hypothetical protein
MMNNTIIICGLIIIIIILFIIVVLQFNKNKLETYVPVQQEIPYHARYHSAGLIQDYNPMNVDLLKQYDYYKAYYPLEEPTRRVPSYEIPSLVIRGLIDVPTRGYPDNYTQLGILSREHEKDDNDSSGENRRFSYDKDNRILRLFGRQEYPGSNRYEYYTMINSCPDQIKIPLHTERKWELYNDDTVHIPELNENYKVKLYKYGAPRYYPDVI